jgi:hypothetical protein
LREASPIITVKIPFLKKSHLLLSVWFKHLYNEERPIIQSRNKEKNHKIRVIIMYRQIGFS